MEQLDAKAGAARRLVIKIGSSTLTTSESSIDYEYLAALADRMAANLSAGQKRRLGLARLLASARPLWLLDEPFAALDVSGQQLVGQLMARHCGAGGIIIAATHEPLGLGNESLKL